MQEKNKHSFLTVYVYREAAVHPPNLTFEPISIEIIDFDCKINKMFWETSPAIDFLLAKLTIKQHLNKIMLLKQNNITLCNNKINENKTPNVQFLFGCFLPLITFF